MSRSRGNAAWTRLLQRRQYAAHFVAFGSLYSTGHDLEEVELIRDELVALGISPGDQRVPSPPRQLTVEEFEHDDSDNTGGR